MARPIKTGLDYYPMDTDIENDDKILSIEADIAVDFGQENAIKAFGITIKLLNKIYSDGYFYLWTDRQQKLFCRKVNVDINLLNAVVMSALSCGLFSQIMFDEYKVLTSSGIQKRYLEAIRRRTEVKIAGEILLCDVNEYTNVVIVDINSINSNIGTQRKGKESKVEESKDTTTCQPQADDPTPVEPIKPKIPNCPHTEIINLYHLKLPELSQISTKVVNGKEMYNWSGAREAHLRTRWAESDRRQSLDWWDGFFGLVKSSKFLTGKTAGKDGRSFKANLEWLIRPINFNKVVEGNYK